MKFSSGMEQGIYVLLILARLPEGKSLNSLAISGRLNVSHSYLKKLLKNLVSRNLIRSSTGKKGGFTLARPLDEMTICDVFLACEGRETIFSNQNLILPFLNETSQKKTEKVECVITPVMEEIEEKFKTSMQEFTLDSINEQILSTYDTADLDTWIRTTMA